MVFGVDSSISDVLKSDFRAVLFTLVTTGHDIHCYKGETDALGRQLAALRQSFDAFGGEFIVFEASFDREKIRRGGEMSVKLQTSGEEKAPPHVSRAHAQTHCMAR